MIGTAGTAVGSDSTAYHQFASGARRSDVKPRYDLIPRVALERLALRFSQGAAKYGEGNWRKGLPPEDTINHIIDHLLLWMEKQRGVRPATYDDDLAAAAWGCVVLMAFEQMDQIQFGRMTTTDNGGANGS